MSDPTTSYPYDTIGYLTVTFTDGTRIQATAEIIGPHELLTASHCVWNATDQSKIASFTFSPGQSLTAGGTFNDPYGTIRSSSIGWQANFNQVDDAGGTISFSESQNDYAVIGVSTDLSKYGWMGLQSNWSGGTAHVTGYPYTVSGDQQDWTGTVTQNSLYSLLQYSSTAVTHGNSGGPVWISTASGDYIVGIDSSGTTSGSDNASQITTGSLNQIEAWIAADNALYGTSAPVVSNTTGVQSILSAPSANSTVRGAGYDVLDLSANPLASVSYLYKITSNNDGSFTLALSGTSSDHVSGILQIQFANETVTIGSVNTTNAALATAAVTEQVALLYQAALGRTPDATGLANWVQLYSAAGQTAAAGAYGLSDTALSNYGHDLAYGFTASAEFQAKYGSLSNTAFVTQLYANVLDRAPDPTGLASWTNQLAAGATRDHVLAGFAESTEALSNATVGFTGQSGTHTAWMVLI